MLVVVEDTACCTAWLHLWPTTWTTLEMESDKDDMTLATSEAADPLAGRSVSSFSAAKMREDVAKMREDVHKSYTYMYMYMLRVHVGVCSAHVKV